MNACFEAARRAGPQATYHRLGRGSGPPPFLLDVWKKEKSWIDPIGSAPFPGVAENRPVWPHEADPPPGIIRSCANGDRKSDAALRMKRDEGRVRRNGRIDPLSSAVRKGTHESIDVRQVNTIHDRQLMCT